VQNVFFYVLTVSQNTSATDGPQTDDDNYANSLTVT